MKTFAQFIASTAIALLLWLPMFLVGLIVVLILLRIKKWDGTTTWFGNWKYGRGENHNDFPAKTYWRQWWFLCIRNPVSNFGKRVLSVKDAPWVWLHDPKIIGQFHWKFGWKNPNPETPERTFIYRPWWKREP